MRINEANLLLGADLLQERKHYLQSQVTEIRREMGDPGNDGRSKNCPAGPDHGSEVCDIMCVIRANLIFSDEARGADTFIEDRTGGGRNEKCRVGSKKLSLDNTQSGQEVSWSKKRVVRSK